MMVGVSISTRNGDGGRTHLAGGQRVSKSDPRVEACGAIDELVSQIGFARSLCQDAEIREWLKQIQRDLFQVGASLASVDAQGRTTRPIAGGLVASLDEHVRRIEAMEGILRDWAVPGELPAAAALDVARTVCRRAERVAVRLLEEGLFSDEETLRYLNRLSDVLWLFSRLLELRAGLNPSLRQD